MLRFYNGSFTSREVDEMDVDEFEQYCSAINIIESRELLSQFTVADYPHLKSEKRRQIYNRVKACMQNKSTKAETTEELARMLGALNG